MSSAASDPKIYEFRTSFVWLRSFGDLIQSKSKQAPMAFLGNQAEFTKHFDAIQVELSKFTSDWEIRNQELIEQSAADPEAKNKLFQERIKAYREYTNDPLHLTPPWDWMQDNYTHHFWDFYLNLKQSPLTKVTGAKAWEGAVPLRIVPPFIVKAPWLQGRIGLDAFLYPHAVGLAIMVTFTNKKGWQLNELMREVFKVREGENYEVTMPDGSKSELKLDVLANRVLNELLGRVFGANVPETTEITKPLSVATFVHVMNVNPQATVEDQSQLHRILTGLCEWDPLWNELSADRLTSVAKSNLALDGKRASHIIFHSPRGRAVWFPYWFLKPPGRKQHKLTCFHRNLTLLVMQTEALALGANLGYSDTLSNQVPEEQVKYFSFQNASRARNLYLRDKKTYRSASPEAHLTENQIGDAAMMDVIMKVYNSFSKPSV